MEITISNIQGLDQIDRNLKAMGDKLAAKNLRAGLTKAGNVFKREIKAKVGKDTGALDRAIVVKTKVKRNKHIAYALTGVDVRVQATYPNGKVRKPSRYVHPYEFKAQIFPTAFASKLDDARKAFYDDLHKRMKDAGIQNIQLS